MPSQQDDRPIFHWYRETPFGKELTICLYTRGCRYGACSFCALPSVTAGDRDIPYKTINAQVDHVFASYSKEALAEVWKLSIFNNGSVLDQETLPTKSLLYLILKACELPSLEVVSLETRAEYVEDWELKVLHQLVGDKVTIEIALGFETHDERIRNRILHKGLSERRFRELLELLAGSGTRLKCYVMVKPDPAQSEEDGIREASESIHYLGRSAREFGVAISAHLNPTFVARGTELEGSFEKAGYQPPDLASVVDVLQATRDDGVWTFVGLDDEGLASEGGSFRCDRLPRGPLTDALWSFNASKDYAALRHAVEELGQG